LERSQLLRECGILLCDSGRITDVDADVAVLRPPQPFEPRAGQANATPRHVMMSRRLTGFLLRPITPTYYIAKERCWQMLSVRVIRVISSARRSLPREPTIACAAISNAVGRDDLNSGAGTPDMVPLSCGPMHFLNFSGLKLLSTTA
jgi:hypothetical protein